MLSRLSRRWGPIFATGFGFLGVVGLASAIWLTQSGQRSAIEPLMDDAQFVSEQGAYFLDAELEGPGPSSQKLADLMVAEAATTVVRGPERVGAPKQVTSPMLDCLGERPTPADLRRDPSVDAIEVADVGTDPEQQKASSKKAIEGATLLTLSVAGKERVLQVWGALTSFRQRVRIRMSEFVVSVDWSAKAKRFFSAGSQFQPPASSEKVEIAKVRPAPIAGKNWILQVREALPSLPQNFREEVTKLILGLDSNLKTKRLHETGLYSPLSEPLFVMALPGGEQADAAAKSSADGQKKKLSDLKDPKEVQDRLRDYLKEQTGTDLYKKVSGMVELDAATLTLEQKPGSRGTVVWSLRPKRERALNEAEKEEAKGALTDLLETSLYQYRGGLLVNDKDFKPMVRIEIIEGTKPSDRVPQAPVVPTVASPPIVGPEAVGFCQPVVTCEPVYCKCVPVRRCCRLFGFQMGRKCR